MSNDKNQPDSPSAGEKEPVDEPVESESAPESAGADADRASDSGEAVDDEVDGAPVDAKPSDEPKSGSPKSDGETDEDVSLPGNPMRIKRGALAIALGVLAPLTVMCLDGRWRWSVLAGGIGCLVATFGMLDLFGTFDDPDDERVAHRIGFGALWPHLLEVVSSTALVIAAVTLGVAGNLPMPMVANGVLVTGSFIWLLVSLYRTAQAIGVFESDPGEEARPLLARHGFWLVLLSTLLYLPLLGSYSLSDPWETHYGVVAREMLARDDWISLWWAQDGWFWSKPILDFWLQGLSFSLFGVRYMPDQMVAAVADGRLPQPEWAARLPIFLMTVTAAYVLYKGCSKAFGRRAALLGGVVLMTMPYWYLIGHQTMTDMPYVAPVSAAFGFMLLAFTADPTRLAKNYEIDLGITKLRVSGFHLLFGAIVLAVLPQILYLISRNLSLQLFNPPHGFRPHWDEFWAGSGAGNCGLPGNQPCKQTIIPIEAKIAQPAITSLFWVFIVSLVLWLNRGERRVQRLFFIAAWFCIAIAGMGKGAPGLVLPLFALAVYIGATKRWEDLKRVEALTGLLVILCVALPWYVQMYVRHGMPFIDRLIFHDMYKRAFVHVHDTNVGDDTSFRYYIWQLGYGLFPWTGLAAGGLLWWMRDPAERRKLVTGTVPLLVLWFVSGFAMFTITRTKFHHYIFPVVPPIAMLTGLLLDRAMGDEPLSAKNSFWKYATGLGVGATLVTYGLFRMFPGALTGFVGEGGLTPPMRVIGGVCLGLGVVVLAATIRFFGARVPEEPEHPSGPVAYEGLAVAVVGIASAVVVGLVGRDMFVSGKGDVAGSARLMHLFTYNYRRPWPDSIDYSAVFMGFTIVTAALCVLFIAPRLRRHMVATLCSVGILWGAWGVNVYLFKLAPHWGQRETILAYYQDRVSPDEPLVAYQMNWKGENFYTGNRIPAFVSTGAKFKSWVEGQRKAGVNVMYFTTEHGRIASLRNELGNPKTLEVLTDKVLNNKFMVARVRWAEEPTPQDL